MQIKDKSKQKNIIAVTAQIIVNKGLEGVSINNVAKRVGISKGTVYIYFANKQELLKQTYLTMREHYNQFLLDNIRKNGFPSARLDSFITNLYRFGKQYPTDMLVIDEVVNSHLRSEFFPSGREPEAMFEPWLTFLDQGKKNNIFKNINSYGMDFFIFHSISGYIKDLYYGNLDESVLTFNQIKSLIISGIKKENHRD